MIAAASLTACGDGVTAETEQPTSPTTVAATEQPAPTEPEPATTPPTEPILQTYPLKVDSSYSAYAQNLPDLIYRTTGSENGLAGTIYEFSGVVKDYFTTESGDFTFENIIVETDDGEVMISNFYVAVYNATMLEYGADLTKAMYPYSVDDYVFPAVGEAATFVAIYAGYSGTQNMPAFYLGANSVLFEMLELEDPTKVEAHAVSLDGAALTAGNILLDIPEGYTATVPESGNSVLLESGTGWFITVSAIDISALDEATAREYLPQQAEAFRGDDGIMGEESTVEGYVAGFAVDFSTYGVVDTEDYSTTMYMETTFTDSWYAYTIALILPPAVTDVTTPVGDFSTFVTYAEYRGGSPRFDFVQ